MRPSDCELFVEYKKSGSLRLRNELIQENQNLARKVAHKFVGQCSESYEDLEQIAVLGLIKAVERFDPGKGNAFSSFAVPFIRGSILHFLRDHGRTVSVPRVWQETYQAVKRKQKSLEVASEKKALKELNISEQNWTQIKQSMTKTLPLHPEVADQYFEEDAIEEDCEPKDYSELNKAIKKLPIGQRQCLEAVFFRCKADAQAAKYLNIPSAVLARNMDKAIANLKSQLKSCTHN